MNKAEQKYLMQDLQESQLKLAKLNDCAIKFAKLPWYKRAYYAIFGGFYAKSNI